jgi:hypothetical protein
MRLDASGNLGLGVTPSAWGGDFKAVQIGTSGGSIANDDWNGFTEILNNVYGSARNTYTRIQSLGATRYSQQFGTHAWYSVGAGSGGATVSFTQAMTLDVSGRLGIGTTSPSSLLHVNSGTSGTQTIANFAAANYNSPSSRTYIQIGTQFGDGSSRIGSVNTTGNQSALVFQTQSATSGVWNDAMYINGSANVGIGTTSPFTKFHVSAGYGLVNNGYSWAVFNSSSNGFAAQFGAADDVAFASTGNNAIISATGSNAILFGTNNTERMRINSSGLVSINTTQSRAQLNVKRSSSGATVRGLGLYNNIGDSVNTGISLDFYVNNGDDDRCARIISTQSTAGLYADLRFFTSNNAAPVEAMRIKQNQIINLSNVPSSASGLSSGDVYKDGSGFLKIV